MQRTGSAAQDEAGREQFAAQNVRLDEQFVAPGREAGRAVCRLRKSSLQLMA
jgi:hypothetical protein